MGALTNGGEFHRRLENWGKVFSRRVLAVRKTEGVLQSVAAIE
jgi:hypothetical protein